MAVEMHSSGMTRDGEPVRALEVALVAIFVVIGLALRAWNFAGTGLAQFDEGVYAFTGLGLVDPSQPYRLFPEQQKFSPPVYFSLVALSFLVRGASDHAAIVVNVIVGTLSIAGIWWITRRWFGAGAAAGAAAFVALSELHVILSRTALTDVTFALVFFIALAAMVWAQERGGIRASVIAGLAVGLAWNTKYHGWFVLVIVAMTIAARFVLGRHAPGERAWLMTATKLWVVSAVVAGLSYVPWAAFIQTQPGSTTGWSSYFATMLRIDWFGNVARHAEQQAWLEGPWSRASVPLALLAISLVTWSKVQRPVRAWCTMLAVLTVGAFTLGAAGTSTALVLFGLPGARRAPMRLATRALLALFVLWVVMAPLYHPYFRLLLPFMIAVHVMAAALLARWVAGEDVFRLVFWRPVSGEGSRAAPPSPAPARVLPLGAGLAAVAFTVLAARWRTDHSDPWRSARALADAADRIGVHVPAGAPVMVLGEPPLAFYLHQRGHPAFRRVTLRELDAQTQPGYLVVGLYAYSAPNLRTGLAERASRLTTLDTIPVVPTDLRLLDDYRPALATRYRSEPDGTYELVLYRHTPGATPAHP
jgi:4-amino-4-deoxy-L-arabinose transferase-like glycosyltransferase